MGRPEFSSIIFDWKIGTGLGGGWKVEGGRGKGEGGRGKGEGGRIQIWIVRVEGILDFG